MQNHGARQELHEGQEEGKPRVLDRMLIAVFLTFCFYIFKIENNLMQTGFSLFFPHDNLFSMFECHLIMKLTGMVRQTDRSYRGF